MFVQTCPGNISNLENHWKYIYLRYISHQNHSLFVICKLAHLNQIITEKQVKYTNGVVNSFVFTVSKTYNSMTIHRKNMKFKMYVYSLKKKCSKKLRHFYNNECTVC